MDYLCYEPHKTLMVRGQLKYTKPQNIFFSRMLLYSFEAHCTFPFSFLTMQMLTYNLQNLGKANHRLFRDRAGGDVDLFLIWPHQLLCIHDYNDWMRGKSVCDVESGMDRCPFWLGRETDDAKYYLSFDSYKKSKLRPKKEIKRQCASSVYFGLCCRLGMLIRQETVSTSPTLSFFFYFTRLTIASM